MARENPMWGEERIANELRLKLGLRVSPRTVRRYLSTPLDCGGPHRVSFQRWRPFVHNHVRAIIACDFCCVVVEHAGRKILHVNVTRIPPRHGPFSSCVKPSLLTTATASSSMTETASSPDSLISRCGTWVPGS
jgi:hypothetical protein